MFTRMVKRQQENRSSTVPDKQAQQEYLYLSSISRNMNMTVNHVRPREIEVEIMYLETRSQLREEGPLDLSETASSGIVCLTLDEEGTLMMTLLLSWTSIFTATSFHEESQRQVSVCVLNP
jgi:hypothetical protein